MFRLLFVIGHVATGNGTRRYISLSYWTRANESEFRVVYFLFLFFTSVSSLLLLPFHRPRVEHRSSSRCFDLHVTSVKTRDSPMDSRIRYYTHTHTHTQCAVRALPLTTSQGDGSTSSDFIRKSIISVFITVIIETIIIIWCSCWVSWFVLLLVVHGK